jgi:hypothetical protein
VLAVAVTLLAAALIWLGAVAPLLRWNAELAQTRAEREVLADHMRALADSLPSLRQRAAGAATAAASTAIIPGETDAVAAAALQGKLQEMAGKAGITLSSVEQLQADAVGGQRRIGLRVVLSGRWPVLIGFMQTIDSATPRMLIDDVQIQRGPLLLGADNPLNASFAVYGFRAGTR